MGRTTWFDGDGMKKGEWTAEEDKKLVAYINEFGHGDWRTLPTKAGLQRCGKSCRLRWLNYLRPGIKRGKFSPHEEEEIIKFHALLGNRWAAIAKRMANRTDNDIKNHWNSCLKKRLVRKGIDPMTHGPIVNVTSSSTTTSSSTPSPSSLSSSSSSSSHFSTTGSASLLNKLATEISSRKHGLDRIKTVILSEPKQIDEEEKEEEEEKAVDIGCFMEIDDEKVSTTTTTSFELASESTTKTTSFVAFDEDYSLTDDPFGFDFYQTEQFDMFLL